MATTQTLPAPAGTTLMEQAPENGEQSAEQGLVAVAPEPPPSGILAQHPRAAQLPVEIEVSVPVRDFRVRNLLALEPGKVIGSQWGNGDDLPITAGPVQLAWAEFEVIDTELAVRVTRLA